jgi:phytanoyl-CoA hydroxylase
MTMTETHPVPQITEDLIQSYRARGFCRVRGIISKEEAAEFREAAINLTKTRKGSWDDTPTFTQRVNAWQSDETLRRLTFHPNVGAVATKLTGKPLRLWHDHILIKEPKNKAPTFFHQDLPYWPHPRTGVNISCWVALCDVPVERGCMSFIPGSFRRQDLTWQNLTDGRSLFSMWPELEYEERVTLPLRAGDCTFHDGLCAHMANANVTEEPRVALSVIMMGRDTRFVKKGHIVTDPLNLADGQLLEGELFPDVG